MTFKKGDIPWNKGTKGIVKLNSGSFKKGDQIWKGKKRSEATKKKIRETLKRKIKEGEIKITWKGKKWSEKKRNKVSGKKSYRYGQRPWNYIDGRSKTLGPGRYGDDWFKIRQLVLKRDNFQCRICGQKQVAFLIRLHIHHIIPFMINFDNSLKNLITLCPPCHRKIEAEIMKELKRGESR